MRPFQLRPTNTTDEAIAAAAGSTSLRFIAGGTTMVDLMKLEVETPAQLLDIHHESPQVLVIRNGVCVYDESHMGINMDDIEEAVVRRET